MKDLRLSRRVAGRWSPEAFTVMLGHLGYGFVLILCVIGLITTAHARTDDAIYVRIHEDGHREFTNRPSGHGWLYYMSEIHGEPVIRFTDRSGPRKINEIVNEISEKFSIDANLVKAIIKAESNSNPSAVSRRGAQGLMQLMPETAKELKVEKPLDPRENIIGGVKYIKGLLASYGNLGLALAAYNAGPGAVKKYAGIPPYRETVNYVRKVIRYYEMFKKDPSQQLAEN